MKYISSDSKGNFIASRSATPPGQLGTGGLRVTRRFCGFRGIFCIFKFKQFLRFPWPGSKFINIPKKILKPLKISRS